MSHNLAAYFSDEVPLHVLAGAVDEENRIQAEVNDTARLHMLRVHKRRSGLFRFIVRGPASVIMNLIGRLAGMGYDSLVSVSIAPDNLDAIKGRDW